MRNAEAYPFSERGIERVQVDLPDLFDIASLDGVDTVIHAAYATRFRTVAAARRVNEEGTARVLGAARAQGVRRFVFISSTSAHPEARSYYGRSKFAWEKRLDPARDLVVRPGLVLAHDDGLAQRLWRAVARLPVVPLLGGGRQIVQTVHIDDLCEAFVRALDLDLTGAINVAEAEGGSMRELLTLLACAAGTRPLMLPLPVTPVLWALRALEALRLPLPVSSENLLGLVALRRVETAADLQRLGIPLREARASVADLAQSSGFSLRAG